MQTPSAAALPEPVAELSTEIAIVGGGPAGLMLAIELGCRGVRCLLLEEDADVPVPPKANASSARTMEHYRRRGFADAVRAAGLTEDHPQDVLYCTRLGSAPLARFAIPSRADAAAQRSFGDLGEANWPTPELPHRGNQMFIEPLLRREVARYPSVQQLFSTRVTALRDLGSQVELDALQHAEGAPHTVRIRAAYAVGCDGPRSLVRETMGVVYAGLGGEKREFFGGQMLGLYFRSPDLYAVLGQRAWTSWLFNREQRGVLVAIDGVERFIFGIQLKPGQTPQDVDAAALFRTVLAATLRPFSFELLDRSTWNAGYMLVAEQFKQGRLLIAGDAAHLFTPTGGMGYNTSVDDAVNLGWKLAAVTQGWAPAALLDSYEAERRPIAERNTAFARSMAESMGRLAIPEDIEAEGSAGEAARQAFGERLLAHAQAEFNIPGIQLGLRYGGPVIAAEAGAPPADAPNRYEPGGYPGARAPHLALADGSSIFDRFGRDFTLLSFAAASASEAAGAVVGAVADRWLAAAGRHAVPLAVLAWPEVASQPAARQLYGAELVLVRPDHHVAWRGAADADATAVLAQACGYAAKVSVADADAHAGTGPDASA